MPIVPAGRRRRRVFIRRRNRSRTPRARCVQVLPSASRPGPRARRPWGGVAPDPPPRPTPPVSPPRPVVVAGRGHVGRHPSRSGNVPPLVPVLPHGHERRSVGSPRGYRAGRPRPPLTRGARHAPDHRVHRDGSPRRRTRPRRLHPGPGGRARPGPVGDRRCRHSGLDRDAGRHGGPRRDPDSGPDSGRDSALGRDPDDRRRRERHGPRDVPGAAHRRQVGRLLRIRTAQRPGRGRRPGRHPEERLHRRAPAEREAPVLRLAGPAGRHLVPVHPGRPGRPGRRIDRTRCAGRAERVRVHRRPPGAQVPEDVPGPAVPGDRRRHVLHPR